MELHKYWGVGGRRCGSCEAAPAAVHCRSCPAGGAFLCTACDARPGHARLAHERVWMCEVCELAPAAVTCKADAAVLCAACDADIHEANPLARRHVRVPVAPIGSEAAAAAVEAMLFGTAEAAASEADEPHNATAAAAAGHQHQHHHQHHALNLNVEAKDMKLDYLFSDLDPYLSVEIPRFQHADSVVPNGVGAGAGGAIELDFTCGIGVKPSSYSSYTATSLAHSGSSSEVGVVPEAFCGGGGGSFELDFTRPKPQAYMPYTATPQSHSVSSVDVEVVPERGDMAAARPVPLMGESREARLMRYREKRKNRRFEKTIRYASRKAYAETRPRIKGRFAKRADHDADADDAEAEAAVPSSSYVLDFGYGVVPSF
ncbi:hypothetical protein SETIT_4G192300v2 [Setaria italica]|uniref:CONSTANS-like protein n=1 Tax=Setaria italica TaxID=4555 RepID=K3XXN2_SETIT|nr:zinc finger protein CONSTANS-LIKE 5 [Setaria italica]RCV22090.1 hypothetical protein SETIT_4G192300v2 [Setaria italica]